MKKIDWEDSRKKTAAYEYLVKVFKTTKPSVSLAMSFKRNSLEAARMRHVAIHELGGRLLSDENVTVSPVKILDSHGNVKSVITWRTIQKIAVAVGMSYGLWLGTNVNATDADSRNAFVIIALSAIIAISLMPDKTDTATV